MVECFVIADDAAVGGDDLPEAVQGSRFSRIGELVRALFGMDPQQIGCGIIPVGIFGKHPRVQPGIKKGFRIHFYHQIRFSVRTEILAPDEPFTTRRHKGPAVVRFIHGDFVPDSGQETFK